MKGDIGMYWYFVLDQLTTFGLDMVMTYVNGILLYNLKVEGSIMSKKSYQREKKLC